MGTSQLGLRHCQPAIEAEMDQGAESSKKIAENAFFLNRPNFFWNKNIPMEETVMWPKHVKFGEELCERLCEETDNQESFVKTEICKYYKAPGGCVRGHKCLYAHGDSQLRSMKPLSGASTKHHDKSVSENLNRKIFIGGLPPSVDSDDLRELFEYKFGSVEEAIVMESEHGHSRGFGFVVFKHERSVASAVQAHHVAIFGKKVEIKSAVPKGMNALPEQSHAEKALEETDEKTEKILMSWAEMVMTGQLKSKPDEIKAPEMGLKSEIPWVETFKKWLPGFLREVSKRLREGELYPLSSLKGDFRATCGLELDHASLGYLKLSDFMRAFPGVCRMKIVPVGRGPATHMVLLEQFPPKANRPQQQCQNHLPQTFPSSTSQSYADAACKTIMPREPSPTPPNSGRAFDAQLLQAQRALEQLRYSNSLFASSYFDFPGAGTSSWKMPHLNESAVSPSVDIDPRFLTFLNRERSFFTPWNPPLEEPERKMTRYKYQSQEEGSLVEPERKMGYKYQSQEEGSLKESERTMVNKYQSQEKNSAEITIPAFYGHPSSDSLRDAEASEESLSGNGWNGTNGLCVFCKENKAAWASVPCGHRVLCTGCKSKLSGSGKLMGQCLVCQVQVKTLIALFK